MAKSRLLLADDHLIVREGLKMILEGDSRFQVVGEAANGDELYAQALEKKPDLIVSDLKMPGKSVMEVCRQAKEQLPDLKVVILTAFDESEALYHAIDAGVDGYIMKDSTPEQIVNTLVLVSMGYSCFQPKIPRMQKKENVQLDLTEREQEIFQLIVENLSNQEIAQRLFITEATVKTHVSSILRKTGQPNRSQAVLYALKNGYFKITS